MQGLTREQKEIYNKLIKDLTQKHKLSDFAGAFVERDPTLKGYMKEADIE